MKYNYRPRICKEGKLETEICLGKRPPPFYLKTPLCVIVVMSASLLHIEITCQLYATQACGCTDSLVFFRGSVLIMEQ